MKPQAHLQIEYVPTEQLVEYPMNAKLHPAMQVDQLVSSIEKFGN